MKAISIDKPCSENWAAMTPSQQGAFCGKCQIDVVDFSNKTPLEVKLILQENVGKHMCGRFKKTQLDDINLEYTNWETQSLKTFQSKFVYALVVVFGMTLFSCNGPDEMIMGDMMPTEHYAPDSNSHQENFDRIELEGSFMNYGSSAESDKDSTKKIIHQDYNNVKGKVSFNYYDKDENELEEIKKDTANNEVQEINKHEYIMGDYAYSPPDTIKTEPIDIDTTYEEPLILGEMQVQEEYTVDQMIVAIDTTNYKMPILENVNIHAIDTTSYKSPVIENINIHSIDTNSTGLISEFNFAIRLFPNPTTDIAVVAIQVSQASHFKIELFDVNGQKLALIYDGRLSIGEQKFAISLLSHAPGTYLVVVTEANSVQTVKIQKVN